jgi:hypothetical protein
LTFARRESYLRLQAETIVYYYSGENFGSSGLACAAGTLTRNKDSRERHLQIQMGGSFEHIYRYKIVQMGTSAEGL